MRPLVGNTIQHSRVDAQRYSKFTVMGDARKERERGTWVAREYLGEPKDPHTAYTPPKTLYKYRITCGQPCVLCIIFPPLLANSDGVRRR